MARGLIDVVSPDARRVPGRPERARGRRRDPGDGADGHRGRRDEDGGGGRTSAFAKLDVLERLLHAAASPSVAYLLLDGGPAAWSSSSSSASGSAWRGPPAPCSSCWPATGWPCCRRSPLGLALVVLGLFGFAVDVQSGAPRTWTAIGIDVPRGRIAAPVRRRDRDPVADADRRPGRRVPPDGVAACAAMVRARFSTPTIGRESMIGDLGQAATAVDPEGTVSLRGRAVAGPDQPGHADRGRGAGAGGGDRRPAAGGGAGGRRRPRRRTLSRQGSHLHKCSI